MQLLLCITVLLTLLPGLSLGVNEKFKIMRVNALPAPQKQEPRLSYDGPYPVLLDTAMRLPQDTNQVYLIRTTVMPNAREKGKVLSIIYSSDYDGYDDIKDHVIEEGTSDVIDSKLPPNGKWRIRFTPEQETWPDHNVSINFTVIDPEGQIYKGRAVLPCTPTPNYKGFYCGKRVISLLGSRA